MCPKEKKIPNIKNFRTTPPGIKPDYTQVHGGTTLSLAFKL